ncbi:hypothetical protein Q7P37_009359 [Cladosporium fusiforme]
MTVSEAEQPQQRFPNAGTAANVTARAREGRRKRRGQHHLTGSHGGSWLNPTTLATQSQPQSSATGAWSVAESPWQVEGIRSSPRTLQGS